MKLYEVNQKIEEIFEEVLDPETGEILVPTGEVQWEQLEALEMEKQRILEYLAKLVLNTRAESSALKEEEERLKKRRSRLDAKESRIMDALKRECGGQKTPLGVATMYYRNNKRLEVSDPQKAIRWLKRHKMPECYRVPEPEVAKDSVKKLINAGTKVPGCEIVESVSCSLR
ncbi:MAG: siphovirus Gp157 family protein [Lachnospiraceae bacterium]|nr:siphovirus Gp157 family protein [Lachnospiraceae bacterium]